MTKIEDAAAKTYLGDGAYVRFDGDRGCVCLATEDGIRETNVVFLEPEVARAFEEWLTRFRGAVRIEHPGHVWARSGTLEDAVALVEAAGFTVMSPRKAPDEQIANAVRSIAFNLNVIRSAISRGGELSDERRKSVSAIVTALMNVSGFPRDPE